MVQMIQMVQVVRAVRVVRTISLDDMHSENIWFSWYKPSKYREKLICHACDGRRTNGGKWKIEQCSVGSETAKAYSLETLKVERQKITKFLNNANLKVGFATVLASCWCWCSNCVHLQFAMGSNSVTLPRPMSSWTLSICPVSWLKTSSYSIYAIYVYIFAMGCPASSVGFYIFGSHRVGKAIISQR